MKISSASTAQDGVRPTKIRNNSLCFDAAPTVFLSADSYRSEPVTKLARQLSIIADGRSGSNRNKLNLLTDIEDIIADGRSGSNRNSKHNA